jgi:phosphoribosylamine--glycine ligase
VRTLVIGSGGREHAIAWKLACDGHEVFSAPGNPGMASLGPTFDIGVSDLDALANLATDRGIDLTVVGPEVPLVAGIADVFASRGLRVFGPSKAASEMEGSKVFCREIARRYGVPMANGESFDDPEAASELARKIGGPVVVKAEGLAAGKGVLICEDSAEAVSVIDRMMREDMFGAAGRRVVVEEFLDGRETSIFTLTDGEAHVVLEPSQDYKRARDDDEGLNTGGMGAYSPVPWLAPEMRRRAIDEIVLPLIEGLASEGRTYRGCLYAGLMITGEGPRLIEINCRFGDPDGIVLMPRLASDLGELLFAVAEGSLAEQHVSWRDDACVSVVMASRGYPERYETGKPITGIEDADGVVVFHAGTAVQDGTLVSNGGRVLDVTALGPTIDDARAKAYEAAGKIRFDNAFYRKDIAKGVSS